MAVLSSEAEQSKAIIVKRRRGIAASGFCLPNLFWEEDWGLAGGILISKQKIPKSFCEQAFYEKLSFSILF